MFRPGFDRRRVADRVRSERSNHFTGDTRRVGDALSPGDPHDRSIANFNANAYPDRSSTH